MVQKALQLGLVLLVRPPELLKASLEKSFLKPFTKGFVFMILSLFQLFFILFLVVIKAHALTSQAVFLA